MIPQMREEDIDFSMNKDEHTYQNRLSRIDSRADKNQDFCQYFDQTINNCSNKILNDKKELQKDISKLISTYIFGRESRQFNLRVLSCDNRDGSKYHSRSIRNSQMKSVKEEQQQILDIKNIINRVSKSDPFKSLNISRQETQQAENCKEFKKRIGEYMKNRREKESIQSKPNIKNIFNSNSMPKDHRGSTVSKILHLNTFKKERVKLNKLTIITKNIKNTGDCLPLTPTIKVEQVQKNLKVTVDEQKMIARDKTATGCRKRRRILKSL